MSWFRSNTHLGVRLALIAMALQIALTFGHVHAPFAGQGTSDPARLSVAVIDTAGAATGQKHDTSSDADCPLCALIRLSGVGAPSVAPALPLPTKVEFVALRPYSEKISATAPPISLRARAPPAA